MVGMPSPSEPACPHPTDNTQDKAKKVLYRLTTQAKA